MDLIERAQRGRQPAVIAGSHETSGSASSAPRASAASNWPLLARFIEREAHFAACATTSPATHFTYEFVRFGVKQAWACLFAGLVVALLIGTWAFYPKHAWLSRYDFLVFAAVSIQAGMLWFKLETWEEAKVILVFHVVGTVMEIFKTWMGSWIYPEPSVLRVLGVPLFTGFMYAAVGSFMTRCWRLFDFEFTRHPPLWALGALSVAIYVNFFTHHYVWDLRYVLFAAAVLLMGPATIHYRIWEQHRSMPMLLAAFLTACFIWVAENVGTFTTAWVYPNQKHGWSMVSVGKLGSWFLLMIVSYTMVAAVNRIVERTQTGVHRQRLSTSTTRPRAG